MSKEKFTQEELAEFKENWGQSHEEICSCLEYDEEGSDDLLKDDYFWIDEDQIWCNKSASGFEGKDQEIADFLRLR